MARVLITPNERAFIDQDEVDRWCAFMTRHIKLVEAEWKGKLMTLSPYVVTDLITPLVGYKDRETLKRIFQTAFITWARKNRKTTTVAAMALGFTAIDGEESAENYVVAKAEWQARKLFGTAVKMVKQSPLLSSMFIIKESDGMLIHKKTESVFRCVASDAATVLGGSPHVVIIDEWQEQETNALRLAFETGTGARSQPLLIMIGTAGDDLTSAGGKEYLYAKSVISGDIIDPAYYACIYEAALNLDPFSLEAIKAANPGYPEAPKHEQIVKLMRRAENDPEFMQAYRRFHLNQYVEDANSPVPEHIWKPCAAEYTLEDLIGCPCVVGIDLASTDDLTAVVFIFIKDDMPWLVPFFFCPEDAIAAKVKRGEKRYLKWQEQESMIVTSGNQADYEVIYNLIVDMAEKRGIAISQILYDPYKSAYLSQRLAAKGFEMVAVQQSFGQMGPPTREFIRRIKAKTLRHPNHPILNWCASNARLIHGSEDDYKFTKAKAQENKIDGMVAGAIGMRGAMALLANPGFDASAHFEEHGIDVT